MQNHFAVQQPFCLVLRLPQAMRFCPYRASLTNVFDPGCRFACPGVSAVALSGRFIGCTSAIQASLIAFGLHDNSARLCLYQKLQYRMLFIHYHSHTQTCESYLYFTICRFCGLSHYLATD